MQVLVVKKGGRVFPAIAKSARKPVYLLEYTFINVHLGLVLQP
jgi:hypothetical protein